MANGTTPQAFAKLLGTYWRQRDGGSQPTRDPCLLVRTLTARRSAGPVPTTAQRARFPACAPANGCTAGRFAVIAWPSRRALFDQMKPTPASRAALLATSSTTKTSIIVCRQELDLFCRVPADGGVRK